MRDSKSQEKEEAVVVMTREMGEHEEGLEGRIWGKRTAGERSFAPGAVWEEPLLAGRAFCACGGAMFPQLQKGKRVYACEKSSQERRACGIGHAEGEELEGLVFSCLHDLSRGGRWTREITAIAGELREAGSESAFLFHRGLLLQQANDELWREFHTIVDALPGSLKSTRDLITKRVEEIVALIRSRDLLLWDVRKKLRAQAPGSVATMASRHEGGPWPMWTLMPHEIRKRLVETRIRSVSVDMEERKIRVEIYVGPGGENARVEDAAE